MIRLFISSSARRGGQMILRYNSGIPKENDLSPDPPTIMVIGKGRCERLVPFDTRTAQAIERNLRLYARSTRTPLCLGCGSLERAGCPLPVFCRWSAGVHVWPTLAG